ncbi:hypothetical protein ACCD10_21035 [Pseudomonas sp. Pseusp122]|uniref:hypothetical protein n=1 Tax=unclassified Pseudomonas TaxID=196821 RepID=UPI0039A41A12
MSFYRSKSFWIATTIFSPLLLVAGNYGFKITTSVYKTDLGNGVIIYADDYVKTGQWVFDCGYSRLISRKPLPVPIAELKESGRLTIGNMYALSRADEAQAKEAIRAITKIDGWYKKLRYRYSALDEYSKIAVHDFDVLGRHNGRAWALHVSQWIDNRNRSRFTIIAEPYDPETYMDHAKALEAAAKSCPVPQ